MTADSVGGVWTYALELARALPEAEVMLATMGAPLTPKQKAEARAVPRLRLAPSAYRLEWMDEPWDDVAAAGDWLLGLEARFRPDVVHLNGYVHAALPWRAPTLVVGHSCVLSWFAAVRGHDAPPAWDRYRAAVTEGLRRAGLVTAPTDAMLAALRRHYGAFRAGRAVPNSRRAADFPAAPAKEPFILSAGRLWDEAKNAGILAHVAPELPWPVHLAGDVTGPDGGVAELPGVHMLGVLAPDAMRAWMGRAAIYALPARYEPFGLSALEAALAGCALVLGDIPSLREVWANAALYVPPNDAAALRDALRRLIADDALRQAQARRARARALGYTPQRMADGYRALYRRLLGDTRPARPHVVPLAERTPQTAPAFRLP